MTLIKQKLERVPMTGTKVKLNISERILQEIKYLCSNIAKVEWSGVLFYSVEGSIQDPENMVINIEDILPMHKGTAAYTEYTFDSRVTDYMMDNETMEKGWKIGHIHSHNTMAVFFSGTDWSELEDNAPNHNFYVSLIVNNFMEFCAKVCFIAETKQQQAFEFVAKNERGENYIYESKNYKVDEKKLIVYDCAISSPVTELSVEPSFKSAVDFIIEKAEKAVAMTPKINTIINSGVSRPSTPGFNRWQDTPKGYNKSNKNPWGNFLEKPLVNTPPSNTIDGLKGDELETTVEEFMINVLNLGKSVTTNHTVKSICDEYTSQKITPAMLAKKLVDKYESIYDAFFWTMKDVNEEGNFMLISELLTEEMEDESRVTSYVNVADFLEVAAAEIKGLIRQMAI